MAIRLGIIGSGKVARFHADGARAAGTTIAGVCDADPSRASAFADELGGVPAHGSAAELLACDDVDAVVIAVPNHLHKTLAIEAMEAGRDVLLEKPMALNVAECDEVIAARDRTGRILQVAFVTRGAPAAMVVRDLIDTGRFGRVYFARAQWFRRRGIPGLGGWFTTKAQSGGGVLIDLGVHVIDLMLDLSGRPCVERVAGVCTGTFGAPIGDYVFEEMWAGPPRPEGAFDVEDGASALLRCSGGVTISLDATWAANVPESILPQGITILGERGGCFFEPWSGRVAVATEEDGRLVDLEPEVTSSDFWADGWKRQHERFAHSVETREPPAASAEHGRDVQAILGAIYASSAAGREVAIDEA